jgi:Flp pilus assembly protein TadG
VIRPRSGRDRGASSIELAMYMPILLFVIFLTVQFSLVFLGNQAASAAAREAARVARSGGGSAQALLDARARGRDYAQTVGHGLISNVDVQVRPVWNDGRPEIRADVTADGVRVVPWIPGLRIEQVVQGPVEEFRPDSG